MSGSPRFVLVTPVLAWPADQGSRWLQLEVARALRTLGEVAWVTRAIGPQREARERLMAEGFLLDLDESFVRQDPLARARRRIAIDLAAARRRRPRALAFVATRRVVALAEQRRQRWPDAISVGVYWTTWPAVAAGAVGRRALVLADVEHQVLLARAALRAHDPRADTLPLSARAPDAATRRLRAAEREAFTSCDRLLCLTPEDLAAVRETLGGGPAPYGDGAARLPSLALWPVTLAVPLHTPPLPARGPDQPARLLLSGHWEAPFNRDGLLWFLREIWPALRALSPPPRLRVVGAGLDVVLRDALRAAGVDVVGWVNDLGGELERCDAVAIPLRYAGGLRVRLLEALAAGRPAVCTPAAARGSGAVPGRHYLEASTPAEWRARLQELRNPARAAALAVDGHRMAADSYAADGLGERLRAALGPLLADPLPNVMRS